MQVPNHEIKQEDDVDYFYSKVPNYNGPFLIQRNNSKTFPQFTKSGHWNQKEKLKYVIFLEAHKEKLSKKQNRRICKVFKVMSDFIKTRNPNQCRSHHQKMDKHFGSSDNTIKHFRNIYKDYDQKVLLYQEQLEKLQFTYPPNFYQNQDQNQGVERENQNLMSYQHVNSIQKSSEGFKFVNTELLKPHEKEDQKNIKTAADYNSLEEPAVNISNRWSQNKLNTPKELLQAKLFDIHLPQQETNFTHGNIYMRNRNPQRNYQNPYLNNQFYPQDRYHAPKIDQWIKCHQLFCQWYSMVTRLVNNPMNSY